MEKMAELGDGVGKVPHSLSAFPKLHEGQFEKGA
jgi:hypothetical protein